MISRSSSLTGFIVVCPQRIASCSSSLGNAEFEVINQKTVEEHGFERRKRAMFRHALPQSNSETKLGSVQTPSSSRTKQSRKSKSPCKRTSTYPSLRNTQPAMESGDFGGGKIQLDDVQETIQRWDSQPRKTSDQAPRFVRKTSSCSDVDMVTEQLGQSRWASETKDTSPRSHKRQIKACPPPSDRIGERFFL